MTTIPSSPRRTCFLHPDREAAARCMGCGQSFCRECVSEHDLRMLCADCLRKEAAAALAKPRRRKLPAYPLQLALGLLVLWFTACLAGRILVQIPSSFHDGEVWSNLLPTPE